MTYALAVAAAMLTILSVALVLEIIAGRVGVITWAEDGGAVLGLAVHDSDGLVVVYCGVGDNGHLPWRAWPAAAVGDGVVCVAWCGVYLAAERVG